MTTENDMDNHPQITLSGYFPYRPWGASPDEMLGLRISAITGAVIMEIVCVALLVRFGITIPSVGVTDAVVALLALSGACLLPPGLVFFLLRHADIALSPTGVRLQAIRSLEVVIPWEALRGMTITEFTDVSTYEYLWGLMWVRRTRTDYIVHVHGADLPRLLSSPFRKRRGRASFVVTSDHEEYKLLLKQLTQAAIWQEGLSASKDNL